MTKDCPACSPSGFGDWCDIHREAFLALDPNNYDLGDDDGQGEEA